MGYQVHGSSSGCKNSLVKPLSHTKGYTPRDTFGLGFGLEDERPRFYRRAHMFSKLEDDDPSFVATTLQDEDFMPLSSLLRGEKSIIIHNDVEASTSRKHEHDESNH